MLLFWLIPFSIFYLLYLNGKVSWSCYGGRGSNLAKIKKKDNGILIESRLLTGKYKRIVRFDKSSEYIFSLDIKNEAGDIKFELFDNENNKLCYLDSNNLITKNIGIQKNQKYYLVRTANNFKGSLELSWRKCEGE